VLGKLTDSWNEVIANPLPSAQNGLVLLAYIFVALCLTRFSKNEQDKIRSIISKAALSKQLLVVDPKPSFLLNHRVYSKLNAEEDFTWAARALSAASTLIADAKTHSTVEDAWSQAFIYLITASGLPPSVRREASATLSKAYAEHPVRIGRIVINGLWKWRRDIDFGEKETAALSAKTGNENLWLALRCVCLTAEERSNMGMSIDTPSLNDQLVSMLVLSRPQLVPHAAWIDTCLKLGSDPGELVNHNLDACMREVIRTTEASISALSDVRQIIYLLWPATA